MQKKKQKQNNTIKQIILFIILVIIVILLTFTEDIIKLANKNKVGLLENTPNEEIIAEPNIPILSAGMIPIKWETDHYVITTAKDNDWYDYKIGKPAYIMLNDGVYQSELVRNMETNGQKLADKNVGNETKVVPPITDITNPNRIILKIINQKNQDPIKAKASYSKDTGLITVQVTYSQYGISKILLENEHELTFSKVNGITTADTTGIELEDGINAITIIDNNGNKKELKIQVISAIYATLYTDGTLAFAKSQNPLPEKTIKVKYGDISGKEYIYTDTLPWKNERTSITTVNFVNKISPISTQIWFWQCSNIKNIENIENLNTKNVTSMSSMFMNCSSLTNLDLSSFDTSNVTSMHYMFSSCSGLTNIDLSSFDTSKVTEMAGMFNGCSELTSINISSFNTKNVTVMQNMFYGCNNLTSFDLSKFDTSNVTNMSGMFRECTSLTSLDLSSFDTTNVTNVSVIFTKCTSLTQISFGEKWDKEITLPTLTKACSGWYSDKDFTNKVAEPAGTYTPTGPITIYANVPPDIYVKLYTDGTLAFCSNNSQIPFKELSQDYGNIVGQDYTSQNKIPWYNQRTSITTVTFIDEISPISTANWFIGCENLTILNYIEKLNTKNVTNMSNMFNSCTSLTSLELSNFDTSNVSNMYCMFDWCTSLVGLDLSSFDTSKVTNMGCMFQECSSLTSLDLSSFDTSNVTDISYIFTNCSSLTQISFGEKWDKQITLPTPTKEGYICAGWYSNAEFTNKVAEAGANYTPAGPITIYANLAPDIYAKLYTDGTLAFCSDNSTIEGKTLSNNYGNIAGKEYTSAGAIPWYSGRTNITIVNFIDKIAPVSTAFWFSSCTNLTEINNIDNLNTRNVTDMQLMFYSCSKLATLDLSNVDTSNVTNMCGMFSGCSKLTTLDLSNFDTSNVTNMKRMFQSCTGLTELDLSNFDTINVTDMQMMFSGCKLTTLDLSNFDTSNVTNMQRMFTSCSKLTTLDLSNFDTSNVTTMDSMFQSCSSLASLDVSNFDTRNVTTMNIMFCNCSNLKAIYVGENWTTDNATTTDMFKNCGTSTTTTK